MYDLAKEYPWIETPDYLEYLYNNENYKEAAPEELLTSKQWTILKQNIRWYKMEHGVKGEDKIHLFLVQRNENTEKYFAELDEFYYGEDPEKKPEIFLVIEEESRYTYSHSGNLFKDERLKQGISEEDVKYRNYRFMELASYLDIPI